MHLLHFSPKINAMKEQERSWGQTRWFNLAAAIVILFALAAPRFLARATDLPTEAYVDGVVGHPQKHGISCEARSAADWATFFGIRIGENELLDRMPRSDNPEVGFVGNPDSAWGQIPPHPYGVHPPPVAAALRSLGVKARAYEGLGWDDLRAEIAAGRPVIVWIIGGMWGGAAVKYTAKDGQTTHVAPFEHTMILTGFNPHQVRVVDAANGMAVYYPLNAFLASWRVLGNRAILAHPDEPTPTATQTPLPTSTPTPEPTSTPTPVPTPPRSVTIRPGDTLLGLAIRYGITLRDLIDENGLKAPYFIYPGQVLKLPEGASLIR